MREGILIPDMQSGRADIRFPFVFFVQCFAALSGFMPDRLFSTGRDAWFTLAFLSNHDRFRQSDFFRLSLATIHPPYPSSPCIYKESPREAAGINGFPGTFFMFPALRRFEGGSWMDDMQGLGGNGFLINAQAVDQLQYGLVVQLPVGADPLPLQGGSVEGRVQIHADGLGAEEHHVAQRHVGAHILAEGVDEGGDVGHVGRGDGLLGQGGEEGTLGGGAADVGVDIAIPAAHDALRLFPSSSW